MFGFFYLFQTRKSASECSDRSPGISNVPGQENPLSRKPVLNCSSQSLVASHSRLILLLLFPLIVGFVPVSNAFAAKISTVGPRLLQQYRAGGHLIGFRTDGIYVADDDRLLHIAFIGTSGKVPEIVETNGSGQDQPAPLNRLRYTGLWPGVDLVYDAVEDGIVRSTWVLAPGACVEQIRLRYNTHVIIEERRGSLRIKQDNGWWLETAPVAWQKIDGERQLIEVAFRVVRNTSGESVVGFEVGQYDSTRELVIDPTLQWHAFLGGSDDDYGRALALDNSGNIYMTGSSEGTWGTPLNPHAGDRDAFVVKLGSNGSLQWNTFLGSSDWDDGNAIAIDSIGNVYVTGNSGLFGFVSKLGSDGTWHWTIIIGGAGHAEGNAIVLDDANNVYVAGISATTWGVPWGAPLNPHAGSRDAFIAKLGPNGTPQWYTFLGGTDWDEVNSLALGNTGNLYVAGRSSNTWGSPLNPFAGGRDAFVAKHSPAGTLQWHTFIGGSDFDYGHALAVNSAGNVYIAGTWGVSAFVTRLDSDGLWYWTRIFGGTAGAAGYALVLDNVGDIYVAGYSFLTWDTIWGTPINPHTGGLNPDAFVAKLGSNSTPKWHTFLGGQDSDSGSALALVSGNNLFIAGSSSATWGLPLNPHAGGSEAFLAKMAVGDCMFFIIKSINGKIVAICL